MDRGVAVIVIEGAGKHSEGASVTEDGVRVSSELNVFGEWHSYESLRREDTREADLEVILFSTEFSETAGMSELLDREMDEQAGA